MRGAPVAEEDVAVLGDAELIGNGTREGELPGQATRREPSDRARVRLGVPEVPVPAGDDVGRLRVRGGDRDLGELARGEPPGRQREKQRGSEEHGGTSASPASTLA